MMSGTRLFATLAMALSVMSAGAAQNEDDDVSFEALSAQWWQWALSIPEATNPVSDTTGKACMVGQRGPVWFLAGTVSGLPVVRACNVAEGVALFFPVINNVNFNSPGCGQGPDNLSVSELRALVAPAIDGATGLSVKLDNRAVGHLRRVRSEPFSTVLPKSDLFSVTFGIDCLVPGQVYSPSVDDGIYVLLRGLSVGQHHLSIQGTNAFGFSIDVFYTLNVVKVR